MLKKLRILGASLITLTLLFVPGMCQAAETVNNADTLNFSISQAYDMALKNSDTLQQDDLSIQKSDEVKKFKDERVIGVGSPAADAAFLLAVSASISQQMAGKTKTVDQDKLLLEVITDYTNLLAAEEDYSYNEKYIGYAKSKWKADSLSYSLGLKSRFDRNSAEATYKSAQANYDLSKLALEKAYENFNSLLGLAITARPVLTEKPAYIVYEVDNLDIAIRRAMDQNPTIWNLQQQANLANLSTNMVDVNSTSLKASMIDAQKAQLAVYNTSEGTENALRGTYNGIKQLEQTYVTLEQQLATYQDAEKNAKVMYDIGMSTKNDYSLAQLNMLKAQKTLNSTIYRHEIMKIGFEKPWAYTASSAGATSEAN
ncbi:MAG: TolC family protein [Deltaproteobacteria bacterium]